MKQPLTCWVDSPLIKYAGSWTPRPGIVRTPWDGGDLLVFNFTGVAVWVYPGNADPRASYNVFLDGTLSKFNATDIETIPNKPLFQATGLSNGPHTLSLHNTGTQGLSSSNSSSLLNVFLITWEIADRYDNATQIIHSSSDYEWNTASWNPSDSWKADILSVVEGSIVAHSIEHTTNSSDAWMQYNFTGVDTVEIYGNVGPKHGAYSVKLEYVGQDDHTVTQLDNDAYFNLPGERVFNASFPSDRSKVLMFHASNLNPNRKTMLTAKNIPSNQESLLALDYATHFRYQFGDSAQRAGDGASHSTRLSSGAISGIVIGALLLFALGILGLYLLRRRRQGKLVRQHKLDLFKGLLIKREII
ncbi:hypothetical protein CPB86DRAFT_797988 [Serendipita vermifera]|nr:hypothetical protein CPB86DRAFT_797988 [Serendipita vermifera]